MAVQKLDKDTYLIGTHNYVVGKCKNYLKKDLQSILKTLGVSYRVKDTNGILCAAIDAYLKGLTKPATSNSVSVTNVDTTTPKALTMLSQVQALLEPNKLWYKKKWYDLGDCKTAFRETKKDELQKILGLLGIPFASKATKEALCLLIKKASSKAVQAAVVQVPVVAAAAAPSPPKGKIFVDGATISLDECASFDEPLLKALAKAVGTSFLKDKDAVCKRIAKKYTGNTIHLYAKDFAKPKPKKTKAPTPKAPTPKAPTPKAPTPKAPTPAPKPPTPKPPTPKAPTPEAPTPKAPTPAPKPSTPKAPTPKAPTPKAPTPKAPTPAQVDALKGLSYNAEFDSVRIAGHIFYFGRCDTVRPYKVAHLKEMAAALHIPTKGKKETGKSLCHKIEALVKTLKNTSPKAATPAPPKPTTPSAAPLLPSPVKAMTAEEIREAVRKCLNL